MNTWVKVDKDGFVYASAKSVFPPDYSGDWIKCNHFLWGGVPGLRYNLNTHQWLEVEPSYYTPEFQP